MKVQELIDRLEDCDPEEEVYVAADPEGNAFRELYGVDNDFALEIYEDDHIAHGPWLREFDGQHGYSEEDVNEDAEDVVILWP